MKIVDRKTFLEMPDGVLFSKYKPSVFENICIKGETLPSNNDFFVQQIVDAVKCDDSGEFCDILDDSVKNGTSFALDFECEGRDGLYEEDQLFAVWEKDDVIGLIDRLMTAYKINQ